MKFKKVGSTEEQWNRRIIEKVTSFTSDLLCAIDEEGRFIYVSSTSEQALGYKVEELLQEKFIDFVAPQDKTSTLEVVRNVMDGVPAKNFLCHYLHLNGTEIPISWSAVWSEKDRVLYCLGRNGADQKEAQQKLLEKDEWHSTVVRYGSDMIGLLSESGEYLYVEGAVTRLLQYEPWQLVGCNVFDLIHPDEVDLVKIALEKLLKDEVIQVPDIRFKAANGEWRWIEAIASNQLKNPAVKALVVSSRDITERKLAGLQLEQSERRFRSLFDNNPDLVTFEDRAGKILDANPRFLNYLGFSKEEALTKHFCDFIPPDRLNLCMQHLEDAFQGNIINFDLDIPQEATSVPGEAKSISLNITKIPLEVNGEVIGVHSIAKDVSEVNAAHAIIKKQAETLQTVFESITDAFFMLGRDWRFKLVNSEFERVLQVEKQDCLGKTIWEVFPALINSNFYHFYKKALNTGQSIKFEAFLEESDIWLEVKAFPSDEGLSVYFSDITDRVRAIQEREKLSLVASKISNGVIITDPRGRIEWVNSAFTRNTGYLFEEAKGQQLSTFLEGPESDLTVGQQIEEKLQRANPFNAMVLHYRKNGEKVWISMDFTPIFNEEGVISQHIVIQKDITFRKEAEERQLEMTRDLFRQNRDLQQFTYIVSHNLRAPVANAMGLADFLTKLDKHSEMYDTSLAHLKSSVFKLDTVLRDLNMILSLRDQQDILEREMVSLAEVFDQVRQYFMESLAHHKGELIVDIDPGIRLNTNRAYIYSIFYNLLSNAIKYRSEARVLQVKIQCQPNASGGLRLDFSDNGSGFDMEKAGDNIFKLYKRFHNNKKGRGIGLFLVKTHVESMGGTIEMKSRLNEGTQVEILLPGEVAGVKS
ncbi:PAS domain S-box protein [Rufibacter latericius]|uniref:histidine kinase n=1 Tax=Rufibacter latericius TaxID=2487040 RepID=A0A3M9MUP3_9BACT|nr:PAS domain S-box protein [Rufibacter latericius]RNI29242.1 PAS domain S-box protein [Rufibacter latericius]